MFTQSGPIARRLVSDESIFKNRQIVGVRPTQCPLRKCGLRSHDACYHSFKFVADSPCFSSLLLGLFRSRFVISTADSPPMRGATALILQSDVT